MNAAWAVAAIAAFGIVATEFGRRLERRHQRSMAKSERLHAQRLSLYNDVARELERWRAVAVRTHPIIGPQPRPPEPIADEEWSGSSDVYGSGLRSR